MAGSIALLPGRTVLLTNVTTTSLRASPSGVDRLLSSLLSTIFVAATPRSSALDNRPCSKNKTATRPVALSEPSGENTLSWIPPTARLRFSALDIPQMVLMMNVLNKGSK